MNTSSEETRAILTLCLLANDANRQSGKRYVARGGPTGREHGQDFSTPYALGQVTQRYYAGGRQRSTQMLKEAYASTQQEAQGLSA